MNYGKKRTRKREHELASKGTMIRKKFNVIFCKALLICFFAVVIVGGCSAFGVISGIIASAPSIEDIDATPTGYLTTVLDNQGNQTATLVASGSNRKYVTINEIPINLQHAFVAIEDERFYDHNGIDLQGILRAGLKGVASGFHFSEGASTITQQLLKNTVFTQWTSEQSMAGQVSSENSGTVPGSPAGKGCGQGLDSGKLLKRNQPRSEYAGRRRRIGALFRKRCLGSDAFRMCRARGDYPEPELLQPDHTPGSQQGTPSEGLEQHA